MELFSTTLLGCLLLQHCIMYIAMVPRAFQTLVLDREASGHYALPALFLTSNKTLGRARVSLDKVEKKKLLPLASNKPHCLAETHH